MYDVNSIINPLIVEKSKLNSEIKKIKDTINNYKNSNEMDDIIKSEIGITSDEVILSLTEIIERKSNRVKSINDFLYGFQSNIQIQEIYNNS